MGIARRAPTISVVARAVLAAAGWFLTKVKLSGKPQLGVQPPFTVVA